ncbi:MAG: DUF167 domain-containing protein [Chloroflexi bacterium]|nr:DUF167 domain-containing protein [Chloroflexota bacterium]MBT4073679.1 DUF167 domain-containing protein [Chloroflexota bacterium]MBT4515416.1 DUF167 domain-containing protein [Chloroflexota bacterium]MBT6682523.1 DUF167 domain-containing protein [Chloroflexota bacterium]
MTRLTIRVQPRASSDGVLGFLEDGTLRMRVTAPPVDGAANTAVCKVLSKALGIRRGAVRVTHGKTARRKIVQVDGLSGGEVRERLSV